VGSHLLGTPEQIQADDENEAAEQPDMSTVGICGDTTVDMYGNQQTDTRHVTTVANSSDSEAGGLRSAFSIIKHLPVIPDRKEPLESYMSTVDINDMTTVVELPTVRPIDNLRDSDAQSSDLSIVATSQSHTDDARVSESQADKTTTAALPVAQLPVPADIYTEFRTPTADLQGLMPPKNIVFWTTEHGDLVPEGRIKRIRLAQDVINSAEESVYDTLWTAKTIHGDDRESFRIVQAGYDYLGKKTRLSKKTIQRIVAKLIDKDFIAIEQQADIYQRTSTVYRVFSYKAVLERHIIKGRFHVAKMGPGFSYVRPLSDPRPANNSPTQTTPTSAETSRLSTVPSLDGSTVARADMSTAVKRTTETVAESDMSTVVRQTTSLIGTDILGNDTSSAAVHQALSNFGAVDDEVVHRLTKSCKQQAPDCTDEEIVHFIEEKGTLIRVRDSRIHSPIGFLLTAVPKCFSGEAFRLYRETQAKQREANAAYELKRQAEIDEWQADQKARLADPNVSDEDKRFIRECLGIT
jgi:predicted transcriptional regulator